MIPSAREISTRLLEWFRVHQRSLPWRRDYDPYHIWVVEIMLQQTQVRTVIPYYQRFMERFPTVQALAEASLDEVLQLWAGLGYYRRARYLHQSAQQIIAKHGGRIPHSLRELMALPGIGRYTAGAIRSIGFNLDAPVVDGNVIRVLARLFGIEGDVKQSRIQKRFWALAEDLIPSGRAREFNQALMEFGATVCTPPHPQCDSCPLRDSCRAYASGDPTQYPQMPRRPETIMLRDVTAVIMHRGSYLLVQRTEEDRWGGLWEFPRGTCEKDESDGEALVRILRQKLGLEVRVESHLHTLRHTVTHHRITLHAYRCQWVSGEPQTHTYSAVIWCPLESLADYAAPAPQVRLVKHLLGS